MTARAPGRLPLVRVIATAFHQRRLLFELVRRDVRTRFAGSRFGLLWSVVNPLVQLVSYGAIFGFVYRGANDQPRGLFVATLFCGLWPWWGFQEGVMRGLTALVDQAALLKKAPLPPEICVLASVVGSFVLQAIGFLLFLALFAVFGVVPVSSRLWLLPGVMALGMLLAAGAALVLAPVYLVVRDTVHVVSAALTVLFFASPVLYRVEALPEAIRPLAGLNPVAGVIGLYRAVVLGLPLGVPASVYSCVGAIALGWLLGAWLLARLEGLLDEYW